MRFMYCVAVILRRGDLQNRYDAAVTLRCGRILILWVPVLTVLYVFQLFIFKEGYMYSKKGTDTQGLKRSILSTNT
ncbi:hypothetical protein GQ457_17G015910 [Hibiscus cannabinus]